MSTFLRGANRSRVIKAAGLMLLGIFLPQVSLVVPLPAHASTTISVWWPAEGARVGGAQPFKALLDGESLDSYRMFWQVDGGQLNLMENNSTDYPHKEALVDLSGWNWKGQGPYTINFVTQDTSGKFISSRSLNIYVEGAFAPAPAPAPAPTPAPTPAPEPAPVPQPAPAPQPQPLPSLSFSMDIWWPTEGAVLSGSQIAKALVPEIQVSEYEMFWQVDGGNLNRMENSAVDYPHKEALIDFTGWNWKGSGPYVLTFTAKKNGSDIATQAISIYTGQATTMKNKGRSQPSTTTSTASTTVSVSGANPLRGAKLWVNPESDPAKYVRRTDISAADRDLMKKVAAGAETQWFSKNWISDMRSAIGNYVTQAVNAGAVPAMVLYDIPNRDCGQYSAGGSNAQTYRSTVDEFALGIGSRPAAVILEPDALSLTNCLSSAGLQERYDLLKYAAAKLKANTKTAVYMDIGHPGWLSAPEAAAKLKNAGVEVADGFALNVSNFYTDSENVSYGTRIVDELQKLGVNGKRFVIDRGRNGNGSNGEWCNPSGRALGQLPTTTSGNALVDAFLWIKGPGGSDGTCNGGPSAGTFWPEYALNLARSAKW